MTKLVTHICLICTLVMLFLLPVLAQQTESKNKNLESPTENKNDEVMETADTMVFRPVFSYRKTHSHRERVYGPRPSNYNSNDRSYDRFPTVAAPCDDKHLVEDHGHDLEISNQKS
ncbi:hypothetical protein Zmor_021039 [Zophobas morio]|uniref:Transmembrane protein n=1 Tax=Zophobas morio TaxID=2755281 RepID=A0AA38I7H8_9CUCU|nr:hypothetical protein Zmor_021039 [Zophobas morio]